MEKQQFDGDRGKRSCLECMLQSYSKKRLEDQIKSLQAQRNGLKRELILSGTQESRLMEQLKRTEAYNESLVDGNNESRDTILELRTTVNQDLRKKGQQEKSLRGLVEQIKDQTDANHELQEEHDNLTRDLELLLDLVRSRFH